MATVGHSHVDGHCCGLYCCGTPIPARNSIYLGRGSMRHECETLRAISLLHNRPTLSRPWSHVRAHRVRCHRAPMAMDRDRFRGGHVCCMRTRVCWSEIYKRLLRSIVVSDVTFGSPAARCAAVRNCRSALSSGFRVEPIGDIGSHAGDMGMCQIESKFLHVNAAFGSRSNARLT